MALSPTQFELQLEEIIRQFVRRKTERDAENLTVHAPDAWTLDVSFTAPDSGHYRIRNLHEGDLEALLQWGRQLGPTSKELYCPFPWDAPRALPAAFEAAIRQATAHANAAYLLEQGGEPIGYFDLAHAGGNPHSQEYHLQVPELGIAIADAWHGRGLGGLSIAILQAAARSLGADAIELTTAQWNEAGWNTYLRAGFEYLGILRIGLDVDIGDTEAPRGLGRQRDERHMVYCIDEQKRGAILEYLAAKREARLKTDTASTEI